MILILFFYSLKKMGSFQTQIISTACNKTFPGLFVRSSTKFIILILRDSTAVNGVVALGATHSIQKDIVVGIVGDVHYIVLNILPCRWMKKWMIHKACIQFSFSYRSGVKKTFCLIGFIPPIRCH